MAEVSPISMPKGINSSNVDQGIICRLVAASEGTLNAGSTPSIRRPIIVAITVARVTKVRLNAFTETSINSMAKTIPPRGALNVAAIPAPAPAAIRMLRCRTGIFIHCPRVEPQAAPIWMMGPSRPTDPPVPIEIAEAMDLTIATIGRIFPCS